KRLRGNSGKAIVTGGSVSVKAGKKVKNPIRYGRPRPPTEPFPSSAVATTSTKETAGKRKTLLDVPSIPIDNIPFHHVESVS
ncbi:hypothetical protein A2U01_0064658, partial [Trifolium medium]|nr:hypothetical protein [Trifolium medium]